MSKRYDPYPNLSFIRGSDPELVVAKSGSIQFLRRLDLKGVLRGSQILGSLWHRGHSLNPYLIIKAEFIRKTENEVKKSKRCLVVK